jgi:cytoskeletal protein CcmA (bactofilin family)
MFRKKDEAQERSRPSASIRSSALNGVEREVGRGGVRIEGAFEGDITLQGSSSVSKAASSATFLKATTVVVAGSVRGDITARRVEITRTGRVWGDVVAESFSTEEGAFLRGQITMEERVDLGFPQEETGEAG